MEENTLLGFGLNVYIALSSVAVGIEAVFLDLKYRKIPNWITFPAMLLGIALNLAFNYKTWYVSLLGLLVGFLVLLIPFILGGIGAGDVKLLMALGAFLGAKPIIWVGLYGGIAGGILSLLAIINQDGFPNAKRRLVSLVTAIWDKEIRQILFTLDRTSKLYIPYGLAIFIGLIIGFIWGPLWE